VHRVRNARAAGERKRVAAAIHQFFKGLENH
jgi:hypothetical protein